MALGVVLGCWSRTFGVDIGGFVFSRLVVEIQDDEPASDSKPDQNGDRDAKGNHASTTATNPTNMIVSVAQCRAGFELTISFVRMSISLQSDC